MKNFKKFLSIGLVLILSLAIAVSSAACDLSELKFDFIQSVGTTVEKPVSDNGDDKDNEVDQGDTGDESETPSDNENENEQEQDNETAFPDNVRFYKYADKFDAAQSTLALNVNSREMLTAYLDYVNFYAVTAQVEITVTYASDFYQEYQSANQTYKAGERIIIGGSSSASIEYLGNRGKYYISESDADTLATKTFDKDKEYVLEQVDYALKMTPPNQRAVDYDDFKLNSVERVLTGITNSEQLRWAVQNGYKPQCVLNSPAASVLNKAKEVLRCIVSDEMDDETKLRAIYEWLALNVQYDHLAAQELTENPTLKASEYDSWYAEGVFNNGKAVCEGYAKAFVIMAGLEGIPAIVVTGNGHAWNKVLLDDKWYVVDATHADVQVNNNGNEVFSYAQFMITDAEKTNRGYSTTNYAECIANTEYNVFATVRFEYLEQEFDLVVESKDELIKILLYSKSHKEFGKDCTVDFLVNQADVESFNDWKNDLDVVALYKSSLEASFDLNGNGHYTFYLREII